MYINLYNSAVIYEYELRTKLVPGRETSLSRVGYLFCIAVTADKPSSEYRFRVEPYRFCSDGNPQTLVIPHLVGYSYIIIYKYLSWFSQESKKF